MSEKVTNVPAIRFKGFTDAWEQREFAEIFDYLPNNTFSRAKLSSTEGYIGNIHYGDILIKYDEMVNTNETSVPMISDSTYAGKIGALLQDGDIVMADAAEDEIVGKCIEITGLEGKRIEAGLHTIPSRPKHVFAAGFLGYYLNSSRYHDQLLPLIQGSKISSISRSSLLGTFIVYPRERVEQELISSTFSSLTRLITLHQRKYDGLIYDPFSWTSVPSSRSKPPLKTNLFSRLCILTLSLKAGMFVISMLSKYCLAFSKSTVFFRSSNLPNSLRFASTTPKFIRLTNFAKSRPSAFVRLRTCASLARN